MIQNATINARYRFRTDPVWTLRESYEKRYDNHERQSYLFPENGFRDLFADLDFGEVGDGHLGMRVGYQQIVWGESDLFRSIDVINPLRIDQNQGAGEKFDEFRSPIFAFKGLYNVGNVGSLFSNVFFEPFFTPGFRGPNSDLIADGLHDRIHEPYRWGLIQGGRTVREAALQAGAWGCVISGAGPTLLALCPAATAEAVRLAMEERWQQEGVSARGAVLELQTAGSTWTPLPQAAL